MEAAPVRLCGAPTIHQIYRAWALVPYLCAYPLIVTPAFYQVFVSEKVVSGFCTVVMDVVEVVWIGFHCVLLATILLLAWLFRPGALASSVEHSQR